MSSIPNGPKDDWSSASEELFRASRSDHAPTAADRERVRRALAQRFAATPGGSTGAGLAGRSVSVLPRLLTVAVGASLVLVATIALKRTHDAEPARAGQPSVMIAKPLERAPAQSESAELAAHTQGSLEQPQDLDKAAQARATRRARPRAVSGAKVLDVPTAELAAVPQTQRSHTGTSTQPPVAAPAAEVRSTQTETPAASPQPSAARSRTQGQLDGREVDQAEAVVPAAQPQVAPARRLESQEDARAADARAELAFLRRIQAALRSAEPDSVLALCTEHERRWPDGMFVQEREGLRAIASCNTTQLGADARARAFLAKYPRTPLGPRVRDACKQQLKTAKANAAAEGAPTN